MQTTNETKNETTKATKATEPKLAAPGVKAGTRKETKVIAKASAKRAKAEKKASRKTAAKAETGRRLVKSDGREGSLSFVARSLIKAGKSNAEVFSALVKKFGAKRIPESHKHYPSWYRSQMVASGLISKSFAEKHAQ